ncbi:alpha-mannosidase [Bacillus sp. FJAT-27225]|uniref:alpha-mannosidase n=1 Tax=Bacillus sp. FJAT-27225 TaxID=1743144 RepID=UPI00080C286F|nr:alpha-mannosidase [Bacillus sp. FJAT-27225]OCA85968.1 alpha-mannosidase [Bacillus sp. FJAT-27225]
MFFTEEKLTKQVHELSLFRYRDPITIGSFLVQEDEDGNVGERPPVKGVWKEMRIGDYWRGRDQYIWLKTQITIPENWSDKEIIGLFDFGKTDFCTNSGFESLLYVNKIPYQGVDMNHQEVFFGQEHIGKNIDLDFRLWSGLEGGGEPQVQEHQFKTALLAWLDPATDDFYFTSRAIIETLHVLDKNQPEYFQLLNALDRVFKSVNWSKPGSEEFYESMKIASVKIHDELANLEKTHPVTVHCIGHTHIDVAWLWRLKHTREKAARSFSTVLRLMEKYPDYLFLQSQPQLYDYIKSDYPDIYEQIKKRIKEGRWEIDGGMWLEADCNIPSGESLVRQILYGTRFMKEEFGHTSRYLWLPDVFGYSWALPQILKKSGIDTFLTTKISWNRYNRMPHDTFRWRGIDGTEVLSHFITTPYINGNSEWRYDYNGHIAAKTVKGIWDTYRDKRFNQDLLLSYGYGDGGGGVNREMLEMRRRLDKIPGLPHVKQSRADEYFETLHQTVSDTDEYVHTWDGELYLEYHRGTYTSQAYNKRMNRKLELLYREVEWTSVLESVLATSWSNYPQKQLEEGWKIILRNQFHDIIPGSSIREVYEDSRLEYQEAAKIANEIWTAFKQNENEVYTVFNSAPWERNEIVKIPKTLANTRGKWMDIRGEILESQLVKNEWQIRVTVPSVGYTTIYFEQEEHPVPQDCPFVIGENRIETPLLDIKWNRHGQIEKLYDKKHKREVIPEHERGNILQVFEDKPVRWDAWDIDIFYQQKMEEITDLVSCQVVEEGPLSIAVAFTWKYKNSTIEQQMRLYADSTRIDFETNADWQEPQKLVKAAFPVQIRATEATYDIQFGNVKRPAHWNTSWDWARFESVGHQWADLSEKGYGVSLLNDCKYGYDIKDNVMRLTLIKTSTYPDPYADIGNHTFTYSLYPHEGDWYEGRTVQEAWSLNQPLTSYQRKMEAEQLSLFTTPNENIMIDALKKAEDNNSVLIRIHDFSGGREVVELNSERPILSWQECDLLENPIGDIQETGTMNVLVKPYEIKTFKIAFSSSIKES